MFISYYIRLLISPLIGVSNVLLQLGATVSGVYLLGQYLASPIIVVSARISGAAAQLGALAIEVDRFINGLSNDLDNLFNNQPIFRYATILIDFINNPLSYIEDWIYFQFPLLYRFSHDPLGTIRPYITSLIQEVTGNIGQIETYVNGLIQDLLADLNPLRNNPIGWILDHLIQYNGELLELFNDPTSFIFSRLPFDFSMLTNFLDNPAGFIMDHIIEILENKLEDYQKTLATIFEKVLSRIF